MNAAAADAARPTLQLYSPAGRIPSAAGLRLAARRLGALGFDVQVDDSAGARCQRFAGDDGTRLAALHRVADAAPNIAMATRGQYGLTRLLDAVDWKRLARAADRGTRWVGHSDLTALHLGLLARTGRPAWAGPMAFDDFSRPDDDGGVDEVTRDCFVEAMDGSLEAVGFRTEAGFDGLQCRGLLWGGNLSVLCALLGTPYVPQPAQVRGGILFLEDVNERPYRIERQLLQLLQAGVLGTQRAVVLGAFTRFTPAPQDHGFRLVHALAQVRSRTKVPILTGLPFGHVHPKVTLPVGVRATLAVQGRDTLIGW